MFSSTLLHGPVDASAVTPSDTIDDTTKITSIKTHGSSSPAGIYLGASGAVKVRMLSGSDITFTGLAAGVCHALQFTHVYATGTDATGIVALFQ